MRDILTVTLNPALDIGTSVSHVTPGVKLRCAPPHTDPGGGGINVSRAISHLGGVSRCFVALGGDTGRTLRGLLDRADMDLVVHDAPSDTRQSLAVTDLAANAQFRFMLPGPDWSRSDITAARQAIRAAAPATGLLVLSGSGPAGAAPDLYAQICQDFAQSNVDVLLDTSGPLLAHLAAGQKAPPRVLRMDQHEAETLARRPLPGRRESAEFASSLVERGAAQMVIVARGADGSVLASAHERLHVNAADVPIRSKVGAGDSFVGGFTLALAQGLDTHIALSHGAAAASAAVMTEGTQLCRAQDFHALIPECQVSAL